MRYIGLLGALWLAIPASAQTINPANQDIPATAKVQTNCAKAYEQAMANMNKAMMAQEWLAKQKTAR